MLYVISPIQNNDLSVVSLDGFGEGFLVKHISKFCLEANRLGAANYWATQITLNPCPLRIYAFWT